MRVAVGGLEDLVTVCVVCACAPVLCPHAQARPCECPNYKYTASFCGIYLCLQYCRNGLRPVFMLSAIFRVYLFFLKLSGLVSEVDRK